MKDVGIRNILTVHENLKRFCLVKT